MIYIEIPFDPVPWSAPRLSRNGTYDPKEKDKRAISYIIREQYKEDPIEGYVALFFSFVFQIPKSASKAKKSQMLQGLIIPTRSDCTNCQKLYEDCLKNVVFTDDRNVEVIGSRKLYAEKGSVNITILTREEYLNKLVFPCKL